jgi:4-aminobutyrate aminotransferase apoenzyme (EC 2.6.1.19)
VNTGHCHPKVMAAVAEQMGRFTHTCHQVLPYENYIRLAERLNAAAPGDFPKKTVFVTTGAESVENAIKIARIHTGRSAVVAFGGGFHGRTFMTMSLTGKVEPYKKGFGTMMPEVYHVPFPQALHGISTEGPWRPSPGSSRPTSTRAAWPRSSSSRCRARAASIPRRRIWCGRSGSSAMRTGSS